VFDASNPTLKDYLERWLSDSVRDSVKPNTYKSYAQLTRGHLIPALGRNKLKNLTPVISDAFVPRHSGQVFRPGRFSIYLPCFARPFSRPWTMALFLAMLPRA
jgi:hypothetical protein